MKRLIFALTLALLAQSAFAASTFFWRAEGTTLSATDDKTSDTSATGNGGVSISATALKVGSNGVLTTNQQDYYIFDSTSMCSITEGTFAGWIQFKTAIPTSGQTSLLRCMDTVGASEVSFALAASEEARITLSNNAGSSIHLATSACNFAIDTWYYIVGSFHVANDDRKIACYNSSGTLIDSNTDLTTDLSANAPTTFTALRVGNPGASVNVVWVDNVHLSGTWAEPFENFHSITSFVPTYSAGPTNGSFTDTTLPFTYTPDQNGTTYSAACTNGQTVTTFANLKAGTCSGGAAIGTGTDTSTAAVSDTVTITGLTAGTTYDVYIGHESTLGGQSAMSSLADRATTGGGGSPTFTVGPTETPIADGFNIAGTITCTGTCTVEAVACAPGDAVPTANEIEAGQCGGGNAALMNASEVWTTAVGNDFNMTSANKPGRFDVYVSGTNGTTDTSVNSLTDQDRAPRAGFAFIAHTSVSTTGICDLDSSFNPDCATGDVFEYEDDTNEDADCNVSFEADGDFILTPVAAGDCDNKRTFNISYEDVSSATDGLFTAPTAGNFTTDDLVCVNNTAPAALDANTELVVLVEDAVMNALDLSGRFTDADGDTLTFTETGVGTIPTGTALGGTGNKDWTGTPTTEDEGGEALTFTGTDECGATATHNIQVYVINTWTVPNLDNLGASAASAAIVAAAPWRANDPGLSIIGYICGTGQGFLNVADQDPNAAAQATAFQTIEVSIVGAVLPDVTGMTEAAAIAAIEAICP